MALSFTCSAIAAGILTSLPSRRLSQGRRERRAAKRAAEEEAASAANKAAKVAEDAPAAKKKAPVVDSVPTKADAKAKKAAKRGKDKAQAASKESSAKKAKLAASGAAEDAPAAAAGKGKEKEKADDKAAWKEKPVIKEKIKPAKKSTSANGGSSISQVRHIGSVRRMMALVGGYLQTDLTRPDNAPYLPPPPWLPSALSLPGVGWQLAGLAFRAARAPLLQT